MSPTDIFYKNLPKYQLELEQSQIPITKKGRPKKNKVYFTSITEKAITAYNNESDINKKNKIYNDFIHYPLFKLTENIINTFKFPYMDGTITDIQYEVISFILQKLPKYSDEKGKAFSYFSIIAKNYLIQNNLKQYKDKTMKISLSDVDSSIIDTYTEHELYESRTDLLHDKIIDDFVSEYEPKIEYIFDTQRDINIAYSVMELFKSRLSINSYHKKALYIMIRDMTDAKTEYITKVVNVIKRDYNSYSKEFMTKYT